MKHPWFLVVRGTGENYMCVWGGQDGWIRKTMWEKKDRTRPAFPKCYSLLWGKWTGPHQPPSKLRHLSDTVYFVSMNYSQALCLIPQCFRFNSEGKQREEDADNRWTLQHIVFKFNYPFGKSTAVIIPVHASTDLERIFSFKFLDAWSIFGPSMLVIGLLINTDVMSRCF